jgi:rubrerythrin
MRMKSVKGTRTEQNLLAAFAGESQARNRYTYFASVAKKEGYEQIAALFLETADNEKEHAKRFFSYLEGGDVEITATYPAGVVGSTAENLKAAAMGEHHEHTVLYPDAAKIAEEEGFKEIALLFTNIGKVEMHHEERYKRLLKTIEENSTFKKSAKTEWKCRNCGYVHSGEGAPEKCPACLHPKSYFEVLCESY